MSIINREATGHAILCVPLSVHCCNFTQYRRLQPRLNDQRTRSKTRSNATLGLRIWVWNLVLGQINSFLYLVEHSFRVAGAVYNISSFSYTENLAKYTRRVWTRSKSGARRCPKLPLLRNSLSDARVKVVTGLKWLEWTVVRCICSNVVWCTEHGYQLNRHESRNIRNEIICMLQDVCARQIYFLNRILNKCNF
jgi:hypothetical protein